MDNGDLYLNMRHSFSLDHDLDLKQLNAKKLEWEVDFLDKKTLISMTIYHGRMIRSLLCERLSVDIKFLKKLGLDVVIMLLDISTKEFNVVNEDVALNDLPESGKAMIVVKDLD